VVAVVGEGWGADAEEDKVGFSEVCYALGCPGRDNDCVAFTYLSGCETADMDLAFALGDEVYFLNAF
jgi:hypothetical protein